MVRAEIISQIANQTGISKLIVDDVLENLFGVIKDNVAEGKDITIRGFGNFYPRYQSSRLVRDMSRNISIMSEAKHVPVFKPAPDFKAGVREANTKKPRRKQG